MGGRFLRRCERMKSTAQVTISLINSQVKKLHMLMVKIQKMIKHLSHSSQM